MSIERLPGRAELMIDILTPIVIEGYTAEAQESASGYPHSLRSGQTRAERAMYSFINAYNFEDSGILSKTAVDDEGFRYERKPSDQAKGFIIQAFADAEEVEDFARAALYNSGVESESHKEIMLRSSKLVILLASISERDAAELFRMRNTYKNYVDETPRGKLESAMKSNPVVTIESEAVMTLDWHPLIKDWMLSRTSPTVGCPARSRQIISATGEKQTLMKYFWTKLIDPTPHQTSEFTELTVEK